MKTRRTSARGRSPSKGVEHRRHAVLPFIRRTDEFKFRYLGEEIKNPKTHCVEISLSESPSGFLICPCPEPSELCPLCSPSLAFPVDLLVLPVTLKLGSLFLPLTPYAELSTRAIISFARGSYLKGFRSRMSKEERENMMRMR